MCTVYIESCWGSLDQRYFIQGPVFLHACMIVFVPRFCDSDDCLVVIDIALPCMSNVSVPVKTRPPRLAKRQDEPMLSHRCKLECTGEQHPVRAAHEVCWLPPFLFSLAFGSEAALCTFT